MKKRIYVLSDRCYPTEDLYFKRYIAPKLQASSFADISVIDCKTNSPKDFLKKSKKESILLIFRTLPEKWLNRLPDIRKEARSLIYILDDDLKAASASPQLPPKYQNRISFFAEKYLPKILELSDEVIVSSEFLAREYQEYNPKILFPTVLVRQNKIADPAPKKVSICYHATRSHKEDLAFLERPLSKVLSAPNITFESLIGNSTPSALLYRENVKARSPKSWRSFKLFQYLVSRNIGLAPLLDTPYNMGKSYIKFLDYAAVGAVGIYSNRGPYPSVIEHGVNGFLANDTYEEWSEYLELLIRNPQKTREMSKNALEKAFEIGHPKHAYRFWRKLLHKK